MEPSRRLDVGNGGLFMGLRWILILIVIAGVVRLVVRGPLAAGGGGSERHSAMDLLKECYARGEIGREEYEQKKRDRES